MTLRDRQFEFEFSSNYFYQKNLRDDRMILSSRHRNLEGCTCKARNFHATPPRQMECGPKREDDDS